MHISSEQKLLVAIFSEEVFKGRTIRQERPRCCNRIIDLYQVPVKFRDVPAGSRTFTLLEPRCPECGRWVKADYSILN
jgi:hypothetical protein